MKWFSDFFRPTIGTGALFEDPRPISETERDVVFNEIVAKANDVNWTERDRSQWRVFPVRNQGQGNTCMANARAKEMGILSKLRDGEFIAFSATHIYQRRDNKPYAGMYLSDVMKIGSQGVTLEALVPSDGLLDSQVDKVVVEKHEEKVGSIFATDDTPIYLPAGDFDAHASVIQTTGKGIVSMFFFTADEYSRLSPEVRDKGLRSWHDRALRHGITLVDAFQYKGVDYIRAEDSAHFGGLSERLLTREFFESRNYGSAYSMRFKFDGSKEGDRPRFDGSIVSMQKCLAYEGLFPANIAFIESVGPVTREALRKFQEKYDIYPATGDFGPKTKAKLAQLFGI